MNDIYITAAKRTAVGSLGKSLSKVSAHDLGSCVVSETLKFNNIDKNFVDELIMGQVLTSASGQNSARQAAIKSGIPKEKTAYVVNLPKNSRALSRRFLCVAP